MTIDYSVTTIRYVFIEKIKIHSIAINPPMKIIDQKYSNVIASGLMIEMLYKLFQKVRSTEAVSKNTKEAVGRFDL